MSLSALSLVSAARPAASHGRALPKRSVLVVDDVPEICDFFTQVVKRLRGFDVRLVVETDSVRALHRVKEERFDVVVSDFRMSNVDGLVLLSAARRFNPTGYRILITGYNEIPAGAQRIRDAQVDAYLQKPFNDQDILLLLFDVLDHNPGTLDLLRRDARELETLAGPPTEEGAPAWTLQAAGV